MISDQSDFRVQIRRLFSIMIRISYRWICNHPFLLGFVGFLYFLHRTCPLLFSSLVFASPVLVCTFVLLGTILSFGEPNVPEIEKEPESVHEAALYRTEVSRDATVVERGDNSSTVERFVSKEKDLLEDGNDDADRSGENQLSEVEDDGRSFDYRPLIDETLDEIKRDTQVTFEDKAFVFELEKRGDGAEEKLIENGGKQVLGAEQSRKNDGSVDEMIDDSKEDQMDLSPVSPWRPMRHNEDEEDDADLDDSLDSESDGAESSSPDASMTDIIPMLDELHPLLHSEALSRGIGDGEGSDAESEGPHRSSSDEGMESDVDSESHGEEGDNKNEEEDDDEEEDEEEEKKEEKEDESKSAIKWTEADQKNVMDLGSLELERNQRLENLIARRRARHNMRLMAERNLIDFDSADIPINMPPISTARQNPFDYPYDTYDDMGLPPIPGSAPSIMFARKNPFDLPYEPNEEKPDLKGDGFEEELSSQPPKDAVFRRHESFSVGPSMLGGPRHDRLRPFFVLERLANEGASYYPFERQLSEVSESKVSSVPDTESVCTIMEDDEKKLDEHDGDRETEIAKVDMASDCDEEKGHAASDHDEDKSHSASDRDEEKIHSASDVDIEKSHSVSDHDEEKSHSSEDSDFDEQADSRNLHHDVAEIILGNAETQHEQSSMMQGEPSGKRTFEEEDSSDSDSSLSEKEEIIPGISDNEAMLISERKVDLHEESETSSHPFFGELEIDVARGVENDYHHDEAPPEDSFITAHPSLEESAFHDICRLVDDHHEEPVYDSSPPSASRLPSFSSVSSDYKPDLPGKNGEEVQENSDIEQEVYSESIGPAEIHSTSDETETRAREVGETSVNVIFNDEDVPQLELDPVQSPVSDAKEETHPNQTMDIEVDSVNASSQNVGSDETPPSESDRELTWSDKSVVEQSSLEAGEGQVPNRAGPVSVVFSRNITFHEYHDAPEDTAELSCLTSDTSSTPAESPEYKTPMVGEDSREEFFEEADYQERDHVVERLDQLTDLHAISQSPPEIITEEADEIKEIDEGLLYELDTIGDFSVKEVVTDSKPGPSSIGSDTANELTGALPVLEARSVEDIEYAFQQIDEGFEVEDVILPSTIQDQLAQENYGNATETKSDLTVVEATSKEDLDNAMNQAVIESMGKQPKSPESDSGSGEIKCAVVAEPSEPLVEERCHDETNVPLKNTAEKEEKEEKEESAVVAEPSEPLVEDRSHDETNFPLNNTPEKEDKEESAVVAEPSKPFVEGRSHDETNVPLNNTPEKEDKEESRPKELTSSDVLPVETKSPEKLQEPSETEKEMTMDVISERVVVPREVTGSSNVEVLTEEAKAKTANNAGVHVQSPESKETPENSGGSIAKKKEGEEG